MKIKSSAKHYNPSFNATINIDRAAIVSALAKDKKLTPKDHGVILNLMDRIEQLSSMKEDSIVKIIPRVDKGQVNLIARIFDKSEKIYTLVNERSSRLLAKDENFRDRYLNNTERLVKTVDVIRNEIDKIARTILTSKNIKGVISGQGKFNTEPEKILEMLERYEIKSNFERALDKGYNPSKKINSLLKRLDKRYKGKDVYIGIGNPKFFSGQDYTTKKKTADFFLIIKDKTHQEQKRIPLRELFNAPIENQLF